MTVLVLGCTGGDDTTSVGASNVGVVINEFVFDTYEAYHKEPVNLRLILENQGQKPVIGDTSVFIYGQSFSSTNSKQWGEEDVSTDVGTMDHIDAEWKIDGQYLYQPQPEMGVSGGIAVLDAILITPELEEGESTSYSFTTRVCYPYKTSMLSTLTSSSSEEMKLQQNTDVSENRNTAGPIQIALTGQSSFVARGDYISLSFRIQDVGGGFSTATDVGCEKTPDDLDRNKVTISIEVEGVLLDGNDQELYGRTINKNCGKIVTLRNDEAEFRCSIPIDSTEPTRDYLIRAIAEYKYYVESDTKIKVDYILD